MFIYTYIIHLRCNPDVGPHLNSGVPELYYSTEYSKINIFARGGVGFLSLIKISHVGCGSTSGLGRT